MGELVDSLGVARVAILCWLGKRKHFLHSFLQRMVPVWVRWWTCTAASSAGPLGSRLFEQLLPGYLSGKAVGEG